MVACSGWPDAVKTSVIFCAVAFAVSAVWLGLMWVMKSALTGENIAAEHYTGGVDDEEADATQDGDGLEEGGS